MSDLNDSFSDSKREAEKAKRRERNARARANRKVRDQVYSDLGLTKVRGAVSGKVYWE